jgi:hypothetical protein
MTRIMAIGAGLTVPTATMLLSREGHAVTALKRDAAQPGGDAPAATSGLVSG